MRVRIADPPDLDALLPLCESYCRVDGHPFDHARVAAALSELLRCSQYGQVLIAERDGTVHGYSVLTWGFSLESGGVEALLDELYAEPTGTGIGTLLLAAVIDAARQHGAHTLFLETEAANGAARRFYARHGFGLESSIWMCRSLHV